MGNQERQGESDMRDAFSQSLINEVGAHVFFEEVRGFARRLLGTVGTKGINEKH